jgi:hypothetical protein
MRLIEQQGLGKVVDKATASRLVRIMEKLPAVVAWRATLTEKEDIAWASPTSVCQRCPALNPPKKPEEDGEPKPKKMMVEKEQYAALIEENEKLKKREDGDRWRPEDTARDIAAAVVGTFSPRKAKEIAAQILEQLAKREKSAA